MNPGSKRYLMRSDIFDAYPLVASDASSTNVERLAADFERSIRARYKLPLNWIAHRWANTFGGKPMSSLEDHGRRVLDAVFASDTRLRNYKICLLADAIRRLKPRSVLELGAGASTFLIAELLRKNALDCGVQGTLISVEGSSDYFRRIQSAMPKELAPYVHLQESNVSLRWFGEYRALTYDQLPISDHYDLVFIDGPAPFVPGYDKRIFALSGDLVALAQAGTSFSLALTDVRWMNAKFFRDQLGSAYNVAVDIPWRTVRIHKRAV